MREIRGIHGKLNNSPIFEATALKFGMEVTRLEDYPSFTLIRTHTHSYTGRFADNIGSWGGGHSMEWEKLITQKLVEPMQPNLLWAYIYVWT